MTACRGGCRREAPAPDPVLALFPAEAQVFASIDFRRVRRTRLWTELKAGVAEDKEDQRLIDELRAASGLDPFTQIDRITGGFPEEARASGAYGLVIDIAPERPLDRNKLLAYLQKEAERRGSKLLEQKHGPYTLWSSASADGPAGFFADDRRFILAAGGWATRMADLARGRPDAGASAGAAGLERLIARAGQGRSVWLAAVIPEATRTRLKSDPRFGSDASIMRFGGGVDLGPDLAGEFLAELSNADDARVMAERVTTFLAAAKKSPEVLLLGVAPYLDSVKAEADGPSMRIKLFVPRDKADELITRAVALLRVKQK